ncbi:MAG: hypothetical protein AB3N16_03765 [Flavobacteriaceae bacterium]
MKEKVVRLLVPILLVVGMVFAFSVDGRPSETMHTPSENTSFSNGNFDKMMDVLTHKRCVNCHPNDHIPKQGEDSHPHYFGMARGEGNMGYEATSCNTCHHSENNPYSGVPGAPEWSLAPHSMRWEGLTRNQIAESMLDPNSNGGRTHEEVMHHLTEHALVLWAWTPGVDSEGNPRELPPVPKEEYITAVKEWFANGARIPSE